MIWENNPDIAHIVCDNQRRVIRKLLDDHREERRPYVFCTNTMRTIEKLNRILVPVTMLEEEVYKAEICTYLARKTGAHIVLLLANDYGSRAKKNMQRIITHIESVAQRTNQSIQYEQHLAIKDSFSIYKEATQRQRDFGHQLLVMTASRDYGLDDLIFGAPEQHVIQHSAVPVMLINPREDLFSLCD